jgi:chromosome partitioning protein
MRILAVMNQKGGCGKTTIAINLSSALRRLERRVLLIDLDPQSHATVGLGLRSDMFDLTTYELLMDPAVRTEDAIQHLESGIDLVPASTVLSGIEQELSDRLGREERLANMLSQLDDGAYDFVVIDCPPSVGLLTFNALLASAEVMIPVDASFFSLHGLAKLRETIEVLEDELQHRLAVHVVCNNLDTRTTFSKELLDEVEKFHSAVLLDSFISGTVKLKETAAAGKTIFELDAQSGGARQFLSLARELIEKKPTVLFAENAEWMERPDGPRQIPEGVLFSLEAPNAESVAVTGEFVNWSREGVAMEKDTSDGLWKTVLDIDSGEYEYRFIVDGRWIRDPSNKDYIRNEFGQENSLLIV